MAKRDFYDVEEEEEDEEEEDQEIEALITEAQI